MLSILTFLQSTLNKGTSRATNLLITKFSFERNLKDVSYDSNCSVSLLVSCLGIVDALVLAVGTASEVTFRPFDSVLELRRYRDYSGRKANWKVQLITTIHVGDWHCTQAPRCATKPSCSVIWNSVEPRAAAYEFPNLEVFRGKSFTFDWQTCRNLEEILFWNAPIEYLWSSAYPTHPGEERCTNIEQQK